MSHRAKEQLQQQQLRAALGLYQNLKKLLLTCRCDPIGLFWVIIECRCIDQNIRSKEENCSDFEKPHKYYTRCSSMIDQEPLRNFCRICQFFPSGRKYLVSHPVSAEFYILTRTTYEVLKGNVAKDCGKNIVLLESSIEKSVENLLATEPSPQVSQMKFAVTFLTEE